MWLKSGTLFTDCKIPKLDRKQGLDPAIKFEEFGFVAERIGLRIDLGPGEQVELLRSTGVAEVLAVSDEDKHTEYTIYNMPARYLLNHENHSDKDDKDADDDHEGHHGKPASSDPPPPSHLQNYYLLLKVDPEDRFEIKFSDDEEMPFGACPLPKNLPGHSIRTEPYVCVPALLSKQTKPLK